MKRRGLIFRNSISLLLALPFFSCFMGTCEPDWEGTYSASVVRGMRDCPEPITEVPGAKDAEIKNVGNGWYDVYLFDPNSPDCRIEFQVTDDNVAVVRDAHDCEGGVVPYGFSIGHGDMGRLHGKMEIILESWNRDITDCLLIDEWTLD